MQARLWLLLPCPWLAGAAAGQDAPQPPAIEPRAAWGKIEHSSHRRHVMSPDGELLPKASVNRDRLMGNASGKDLRILEAGLEALKR